jgi:hypothetical protein
MAYMPLSNAVATRQLPLISLTKIVNEVQFLPDVILLCWSYNLIL